MTGEKEGNEDAFPSEYEEFKFETQNLYGDEDIPYKFVPNKTMEDPFYGMEWSTIQQCKNYHRKFAIMNGFEYTLKKNDRDRVRGECIGNDCDWYFYAIVPEDELEEQVKLHHLSYKPRDIVNQVCWDYRAKITYFVGWHDKPICVFLEELSLLMMTLMRKIKLKAATLDANDVVPKMKKIYENMKKWVMENTWSSSNNENEWIVLSRAGTR
ncbi:hypothetical protein IFM89_005977 [Coptis chinensis]|uniref:Transposase MuDR plant domain-containing protein n=1 Tax=Coptis chinensis TaxID=261450 RepID=A0A835IUJ8_9MAGN|nr:hypothetical protein IFM89_005977 [Coptis chinensis]